MVKGFSYKTVYLNCKSTKLLDFKIRRDFEEEINILDTYAKITFIFNLVE